MAPFEAKTIYIINQYSSTTDTGFGGRHHYLAQELVEMGHRVYVIAARQHHLIINRDLSAQKPVIESVDGYHFIRLNTPKYSTATDLWRAIGWLCFSWKITRLKKIIPQKPDIILYSSPSLPGYLGAKRLAKKTGAKLIFEVRDIWPLSLMELGNFSSKNLAIRFLQYIEDHAYKHSDAVISNLPYAVDHMETRGLDRSKFTWIPNGVATTYLPSAEQNQQDAYPLIKDQKSKFTIGYLGTIGIANDLGALIDAAKALQNEPDIAFVLVGKGSEKEALQQRVLEQNLHNVSFIDPVPKNKVQSVLQSFDVCYIGLKPKPLFRFGISANKLFDYFLSGKPILYAIDSGPYRPVEELDAGLQAMPSDNQSVIDAILKLHAMPKSRLEEMGRNGKKHVCEKHNWKFLAQQLHHVITQKCS